MQIMKALLATILLCSPAAPAFADEPTYRMQGELSPAEGAPDAIHDLGDTSLADLGLACPDEPNLLDVAVSVATSLNPKTGYYTYSYTVANKIRSLQDVSMFAVDAPLPVDRTGAPPAWLAMPFGYRDSLGWSKPPDDVEFARYQLKAGQSLSGFSLESQFPPGPVRYYAEGRVYLPAAFLEKVGEGEAELLENECPGYARRFPEHRVSGITSGPVPYQALRISLSSIQGTTKLTVLGSQNNELTSLDTTSIRINESQTPIDPAKISFSDVNGDGIRDLVIPLQLPKELPCYDRVVSLTAKAHDGAAMVGFVDQEGGGCIAAKPTLETRP